MIAKEDFYYGAALAQLLEHGECHSLRKCDGGYLVNDKAFVVLKYSTKAGTPWRFQFTKSDLTQIYEQHQRYNIAAIGLVCGGDGVCGLHGEDLDEVLGAVPGTISASRRFRQRYDVTGPRGTLRHKIPVNQWPSLAFFHDEQEVQG